MVNPSKGLLNHEDGESYLGKGIEAKILIEEVERTSINKEEKTPLGLRMFNYKMIDLNNEIVREELNPDMHDIDEIMSTIKLKNLVENKSLSPMLPVSKTKEKVIKQLNEPLKNMIGKNPIILKRVQRGSTKMIDKSNSKEEEEIDTDKVEQQYLSQLLSELVTKKEDKMRIQKFISYYFNELIMKDLNSSIKKNTQKQTKVIQDKKSTFLYDYMDYLRQNVHLQYQSYSWSEDQLDGNVLGSQKLSLYPMKIRPTNTIE